MTRADRKAGPALVASSAIGNTDTSSLSLPMSTVCRRNREKANSKGLNSALQKPALAETNENASKRAPDSATAPAIAHESTPLLSAMQLELGSNRS
jgi:hypothetical protein